MSVGAPSSRDPQKDKKLITEIGVLANAEEVGSLWEKEGQKKAQELFSVLDESFVVSKNGGTIKRLTELKQMIQGWKNRLDNDPNALFQASTYTVLDRDSELIQERIDLLQKLGNPKEEFAVDVSGRCDVVNTVYHQFPGEYDFKIKMDAKSFYRGGDRITLTDYNNNEGVTVKGPKGTLIVKIENGQLVIEPMHLIDKRFSFTLTGTYTKSGTSHGLALTRRFVIDPVKTASTSIETEEELRRRLNATVPEMLEVGGIRMPHQGFGGFQLQDAERDIGSAVRNGAKQIDLATGYTDMKTGLPVDQIVKKLKDAGQLNGVYITSKISPRSLPEPVTLDAARTLVQEHILNCGGKIDTLHVHMIRPTYTAEEVKHILDAIQEQVNLGTVGSMGMSNCSLPQLQWALDQGYPIKVIQVEGSPYYRDEVLRAFCKANNIIIQVYAPFGGDKDHDQKMMDYDKPKPVDNPLIRDIATKLGKTPQQIILRRLVQQGVVPLAQSINPAHQQQNQDIYDRELSDDDMQVLNGLQNGTDGSVYTKLYLDEGVFTHEVPGEVGGGRSVGVGGGVVDEITRVETPGELKFTRADLSAKTAVVSDVESMFEERALHQAEEKLREEYEALGKMGLFSNRRVGARLKMFLTRDFKRGRYMRGLMRQYAKNGTDLLNPEMTAAAERHEKLLREFTARSEGESNVKPIGEAVEVPEVNQLCKRYLTQVSPAVMTDDQFQTLFDEIIGRNPTLRSRVGTMSKYRAGNILLHLRAEREYRSLIAKMERALEGYVRSGNRDSYNTEVAVFVRDYVAHTKINVPDNIRFLMNAPENIERTKQWFAHEKGRLALEAQNYRRKIDLVVGGSGAYAINNIDREQNPLARLGSKLKKSPYGPYLKIAGYAAASTTAIVTGSWVWPILYGGTVYVARKVSDATEEQKGAEKRAVRGFDEQNTYYENMRDIRQNTENYKGNFFQKARMKYQARRQVRLFGETTHRGQMTDIHVTMQNLEQSLITGEMLQPRLIDALVRIDLYHKTGHNFFAQQHDLKMEETLMQLYSLVQSGTKALRTTLEGLRAHGDYGAQFDDLLNGYNDTLDLFKERRTKLGVRHAVGYTATALVMRGLFSRMDIGGMKTMKLNQEVIDSFDLQKADVDHMEAWLLSGKKTPEALWTELKHLKVDSGLMTEGQFNTLKNAYISAIDGGARGMWEHGDLELLKNAGKSLPNSITDSVHLKTIAFLSQPNIGVCAPTDGELIFNTLQQIKAHPENIADISEDLRRKVGEYVYCFLKVGTDAKAGLLGAHMHEQKNWIPMILGTLGLPMFHNTFLKEITGEKADEIIAPRERVRDTGTTSAERARTAVSLPPLSIVTDPKKHTIDHGVIGEDAVSGYDESLAGPA